MTLFKNTPEIPVDEIPDEIKQEIASVYGEVDYNQYGIDDYDTKSRTASYMFRSPLQEDIEALEFNENDGQITVLCAKEDYEYTTSYVIRLNEGTTPPSIRAVFPIGPVLGSKLPLEQDYGETK